MSRISALITTTLVICAALVASTVAQGPDQEKSHDALALARAKAGAENQRVLMLLTGGDAAVEDGLIAALSDYRALGKLLKYEYQLAALPADSRPGKAVRHRLKLGDLALPALVALTSDDAVLGTLPAEKIGTGNGAVTDRIRGFLEAHKCAPLHARKILADGLATARQTERQVFIYLSAPW